MFLSVQFTDGQIERLEQKRAGEQVQFDLRLREIAIVDGAGCPDPHVSDNRAPWGDLVSGTCGRSRAPTP